MSMNDFLSMLSEEQKAALLQALQDENNPTVSHVPEQTKKESIKHINENFTVSSKQSNNRRKEQVRARKNEWVDTGEFRDIETPKGERVARTREPHKKSEVECSVCGKSFKVDKRYIYGEYHRCSRCVRK